MSFNVNDKRTSIPARASNETLVRKYVTTVLPRALPLQQNLHVIEECTRDEGLMDAGERLAGTSDQDRPCIEGIAQHPIEIIASQHPHPVINEAAQA